MARPRSLGLILIASAALASSAVMGLRSLGVLEPLELRAWDALLRARIQLAGAPGPARVAVVLVGEDDIARFGHPLSDDILAAAVGRLLDGGARAVGVDLYRDRPVPPGQKALRELVLSDARIVMVEKVPSAGSPGVPPPSYLETPSGRDRVGFSDLVMDRDGVVRRALLFLWDAAGRAHSSLALQLALRDLATRGVQLETEGGHSEQIRLGAARLVPLEAGEGGYARADAGGYQILLDYGAYPGNDGDRSAQPTVGLGQLLDGDAPTDFAAGRVVLLGTRSPSVRDDFLTPIDGPLGVGVEVHAATVDQLLREALDGDRPIHAWGWPGTAAAVVAFALLGAAAGVAIRSPLRLASSLAAAIAGAAALALIAIAAWGLWLPAPPAALALLAAAGAGVAAVAQRERTERAFLTHLFGRYLSPEVTRHLMARRDELLVGGRPKPQRLVETILVIDIEDSSRAAGRMASGEFVDWIDTALGAMARIAQDHGGMVEYFSGDGLKADFGVPIPRQRPEEIAADASAAVRAALSGADALREINAGNRAAGRPVLRMRMGIHTGETVAGSVGSDRRLQYTTLGEAANLAARLESFEKEAFRHDRDRPDCRILVSETTLRHLADGGGGASGGSGASGVKIPELQTKPVGIVKVPDSSRQVGIYEIVSAG